MWVRVVPVAGLNEEGDYFSVALAVTPPHFPASEFRVVPDFKASTLSSLKGKRCLESRPDPKHHQTPRIQGLVTHSHWTYGICPKIVLSSGIHYGLKIA